MHANEDRSVEGRFHAGALAAVLGLAFLLRVWGIGFGIPHIDARPDEIEVVGRAVRLLSGDLNPHFFHYPSFFFYLVGAVVAAWTGITVLTGGTVEEVLTAAAVDPSQLILMARWLSALAGVATVAVVYGIGRRFSGTGVGLMAALFLAVSPLHARDSHFATTDVTLALFLSLAIWALLAAYEEGRVRDYALAGLFAGLAASTKYVGFIMPGALVVAHLMRYAPQIPGQGLLVTARKALNTPGPWVFLGAGVGAFVLTSPYVLLDWGLFTSHFRFQLAHLSGGQGLDLGIGAVYHLRNTLPKGLGWPVFLAASGGALLAFRKVPHRTVVLLAFPVLFYASTATSRTLFLRYMIPLLPFVCVLSGYAVHEMRTMLFADRARVTALLAVALAVLPSGRSVQMDRVFARTDSRILATQWLTSEASAEPATVYQTGAHWAHLELPLQVDSLATLVSRAATEAYTPGGERPRAYQRLQAGARLEARRRSVAEVGGFRTVHFDSVSGFPEGDLPDWVVVLESPLVLYTNVSPSLARVITSDYTEAHRVEGVPVDGPGWYDQHDAFFVPLSGFRGVARPGPTVRLFRRLTGPDGSGKTPEPSPKRDGS